MRPTPAVLLIVLLALMSGHRLHGQEPTPAVRGPPAWVAVLLTEAMAFGAGYASTLDAAGDEGVGITYGVAGSVTLALPLLAGERPEFLLPYGIGLLTLAYYNLRFGDTHSDSRKLWTNVVGANAVVATAVASSVILSDERSVAGPWSRFRVGRTPYGIALTYSVPR